MSPLAMPASALAFQGFQPPQAQAQTVSPWVSDPMLATSPLGISGADISNLGGLAPQYGGPQINMGMGAAGGGTGLGFNMPTANLALGGLQTLGALWSAFQANKLAKQQFKFTKDITNTNLANQIKSYNTALFDRGRSRAVVEGQTDSDRDAYYEANKLSRGG